MTFDLAVVTFWASEMIPGYEVTEQPLGQWFVKL
jgi:hypothetical protein